MPAPSTPGLQPPTPDVKPAVPDTPKEDIKPLPFPFEKEKEPESKVTYEQRSPTSAILYLLSVDGKGLRVHKMFGR